MQERWGHIPDLDVEKHLWHGSGATDPSLIYTDEYGEHHPATYVKDWCQSRLYSLHVQWDVVGLATAYRSYISGTQHAFQMVRLGLSMLL